ncbi:hypothetical protein SAMN04489730_0936 [Amycolatopsis australiensis]|uniref:Uncharacterized protein n=1 Tax=Amycolatopsis australiensis TaxID=546364 RepID=A0A1K1PS76_9PSEU|nr:hypothetical protein SAMN04489730_0936 [Amycolatopsis australiensis]
MSSNDSGAWHSRVQAEQEAIDRARREAAAKEGKR